MVTVIKFMSCVFYPPAPNTHTIGRKKPSGPIMNLVWDIMLEMDGISIGDNTDRREETHPAGGNAEREEICSQLCLSGLLGQ